MDEEKTTRNRLGKETSTARRAKKLTGKATWSKNSRKEETPLRKRRVKKKREREN